MRTISPKGTLRTAILAAGALTFFAATASAQDYNRGYDDASYGNSENVYVTVPRYHPQRSELGAPYRLVSLSKPVHFEDLNLRSRHGARVLRARVREAARTMCRRLDAMYPVTAPNSPGCYTTALNDAMYRVNMAIADARGYAREY